MDIWKKFFEAKDRARYRVLSSKGEDGVSVVMIVKVYTILRLRWKTAASQGRVCRVKECVINLRLG